MLNLNEYNESLYKALDKKNRKKNMVENYGKFLMHAKKTSGVTNLPDKTWLIDEVRGAISEAYKVLNKKSMQVNESNDPTAIYDACRGEISVLAKLIRKANAGGLDSSYITQLNNYRNELESRAEEARSAMSRDNQSSKVARHSEEAGEALEHGEKWRKHKYIRIENGRYIYPEDLEKMGKQNTYLNNMAKKEKAAADAQKAFQNNPTKENYGNWNIALKERKQTKDAMKLQADVKKAENAEKAARDAQQKANYEKNKAAAEAMSQNNQKNSTVAKNQQQSNYEKNKKAAEAMAQKQQANSTVVKNQQQSNYEKNKAAASHEGDRYSEESLRKQHAHDYFDAVMYKNKKINDEINKQKMEYNLEEAIRKREQAEREGQEANKRNAREMTWEAKQELDTIMQQFGLSGVRDAAEKLGINKPTYEFTPGEYKKVAKAMEKDYKETLREFNEITGRMTEKEYLDFTSGENKVERGGKRFYEVERMKKMIERYKKNLEHSSFSISDEEMEAFLAHKAN